MPPSAPFRRTARAPAPASDPPALRCRRLRCWRTFRPRCSRQSSRTSICRACGRCVASRTPCVRSSVAATSRRHGTLSGASRLTRRQPAPWRLAYIARAACLGLPQLSAHLCPSAAWARPAVTGSSFDTGVASAQPGRTPVASAEEEAGLRDRICRGRRAGDRAGGPQPPASAAAAATATASTHHRRSCARSRFRERLDERLDERLGICARTRPLEQRVQCRRRLQSELEL